MSNDEGTLVEAAERGELDSLRSGQLVAALNSSEISQAVATAKAYPRSLTVFRKEAYELVTQDQESAAACIYALPRGKGTVIKGPTARFAEAIAYSWGNCRQGARIVAEDDEYVTAQGVFYDVEKNVAVSVEVRRRIVDSKGQRYSLDMITMTANAACSIALRNAVLRGVPQPAWKGLYLSAEQTVQGDRRTLVDRRQAIIDQFKAFGVTPGMVCGLAGVQGTAEIGMEQLVALQGMLTSLKDGETTIEALLADMEREPEAQPPAAKPKSIKDAVAAGGVRTAQAKLEERRKAQIKQAADVIKADAPAGENW